MQRVVLDSNAVDPLIDLRGAEDFIRSAVEQGQVELLSTHVTLEELSAISDQVRRERLVGLITDLGQHVSTGATVLGNWKLGQDRLTSEAGGKLVKAVQAGNVEKHTRDALYAATAQAENCDLVTNDRALANKAGAQGVHVISTDDFLTGLGFDVAKVKAAT
jgi:predicted nucleic acid-binding protein